MLSAVVGKYSRGDTLIEVLLSVTVLSMVAVGGLTIMNQGTNTAQRALEISLVRNEIDAQAETIRFLYDSYVAAVLAGNNPSEGASGQWQQIISTPVSRATSFGELREGSRTCAAHDNAFVVSPRTGQKHTSNVPIFDNMTFAQVRYDDANNISEAQGIWVETVAVAPNLSDNISGYYDFHIRACWDAPGSDAPMTLGTIVRLYAPEGLGP